MYFYSLKPPLVFAWQKTRLMETAYSGDIGHVNPGKAVT
jgi:hypothetical protein